MSAAKKSTTAPKTKDEKKKTEVKGEVIVDVIEFESGTPLSTPKGRSDEETRIVEMIATHFNLSDVMVSDWELAKTLIIFVVENTLEMNTETQAENDPETEHAKADENPDDSGAENEAESDVPPVGSNSDGDNTPLPPEVIKQAAEFLVAHGIGIGENVQMCPGNVQCGADIEAVQIPMDRSKQIQVKVSMSNSPTTVHWLADLDGGRGIAIVGYKASEQLEIGDINPDDTPEQSGQTELDIAAGEETDGDGSGETLPKIENIDPDEGTVCDNCDELALYRFNEDEKYCGDCYNQIIGDPPEPPDDPSGGDPPEPII